MFRLAEIGSLFVGQLCSQKGAIYSAVFVSEKFSHSLIHHTVAIIASSTKVPYLPKDDFPDIA